MVVGDRRSADVAASIHKPDIKSKEMKKKKPQRHPHTLFIERSVATVDISVTHGPGPAISERRRPEQSRRA
jgi:hypothetical protein